MTSPGWAEDVAGFARNMMDDSALPGLALGIAQEGVPVDTPLETYRDYSCPPEQLAAYVGEYRSGESGRLTVTAQDNTLAFTTRETSRLARPVGEHAFVTPQDRGESYSRFLIDDTGNAYAVASGTRILQRASTSEEKGSR